MPAPPWKIEVGLEPVIERWVASNRVSAQVAHSFEARSLAAASVATTA